MDCQSVVTLADINAELWGLKFGLNIKMAFQKLYNPVDLNIYYEKIST